MANDCSLDERVEQSTYNAIQAFKGKSTSFREIKPGVILMPVSHKFDKSKLWHIANKNAERVSKKMGAMYGPKFAQGWTSINNTLVDSIEVTISTPNILVQAWRVKYGDKDLEEVNDEFDDFKRDIAFFKGDTALLDQEKRDYQSDADYYKNEWEIEQSVHPSRAIVRSGESQKAEEKPHRPDVKLYRKLLDFDIIVNSISIRNGTLIEELNKLRSPIDEVHNNTIDYLIENIERVRDMSGIQKDQHKKSTSRELSKQEKEYAALKEEDKTVSDRIENVRGIRGRLDELLKTIEGSNLVSEAQRLIVDGVRKFEKEAFAKNDISNPDNYKSTAEKQDTATEWPHDPSKDLSQDINDKDLSRIKRKRKDC